MEMECAIRKMAVAFVTMVSAALIAQSLPAPVIATVVESAVSFMQLPPLDLTLIAVDISKTKFLMGLSIFDPSGSE